MPASGKSKSYSAKDIEVLEGLEPVRRRPAMYIGGSDEYAMHHLAAELLDNNEDGVVDDDLLRQELADRGALIPIFTSEWSQAADNFFDFYMRQTN